MTWRGLVVVVLLAAAGVTAGVVVADRNADEPVSVEDAVPVAGTPALPTTPPITVKPDPDTPPLARSVATHREKIKDGPRTMQLPVPNGWLRTDSASAVWSWTVPGQPTNTFFMRVSLPSGDFPRTLTAARDARIAQLESAEAVKELEVDDASADTLEATYVLDGYRRVTFERFLSLSGGDTVEAVVTLIGRTVDRDGMAALLEKVTAQATR